VDGINYLIPVDAGLERDTDICDDASCKARAAPSPAPGGTARLRVISRNQLRAVWSLPNNDLILSISVARNSCVARINARLKGGAREYIVYDSGMLVYCGRPKIGPVSCQAH
jgi:aspartate/tyrosine/aromatic aminotransferase